MKGFFPGWWLGLGLVVAACTANGRDVGYLTDASQQNATGGRPLTSSSGGSANTGASTGEGGSSSGGVVQGRSGGDNTAGSGANTGSGGKSATGGRSPTSGGSGGALVDAASPPTGSGGSPPHGDAATDSGGREPAEITLQCWSGTPSKAMATFDKTCQVDGDCVVEEHWNGCCSITDIGVAASQKSSFETFEQQTCGGPPPCGCCCNRTVAEDGNPVVPPATGKAVCRNGACMTVAP